MVGPSHLAIRLGTLVRELGLEAVLVALESPGLALRNAWMGRRVLEVEAEDPELLERIPLAEARAVLLCAGSDGVNLALALRIRERFPELRLVISFFNARLGKKLEAELGHCAVLSSAEISAPGFAAAALGRRVQRAFVHEGVVLGLLPTREGTRCWELQSLDAQSESIPLLHQAHRAARQWVQHRGRWDRYVIGILSAIALLLAGATAYFHFDQGLSWLSALYFVVTTFCTVGYGDYSLREASNLTKLAGILLMLASVSLTAGLFAILTNALVQKRTDVLEGRRRYRMRGHVIVCGLGLTGLRIVECLRTMGLKVLVIEKDRDNPLLQELMAQRIPYMVADGTRERVLLDANLPAARALICAFNEELVELEIGLVARSLCPQSHLVLRIFDGAFAERIEKQFRIHTAISASSLAASVFLAKALDDLALDLLEGEGRWYLLRASLGDSAMRLREGHSPISLKPIERGSFDA